MVTILEVSFINVKRFLSFTPTKFLLLQTLKLPSPAARQHLVHRAEKTVQISAHHDDIHAEVHPDHGDDDQGQAREFDSPA